MAQIQSPATYVTGDDVTATNLNAHVNGAIVLPGVISDQTTSVTLTPASDYILVNQGGVLRKVNQATFVSDRAIAAGGSNASGTWPIAISGNAATATALASTAPVSNGGTGATTLTGYIKGSGTSPFTASATIPATDIAAGTAGISISGNAATATALTSTLSVANGGTGVNSLTGYVKGSGTSGLTASATIPATDIAAGTAGINISGNAATATLATTATTANALSSTLAVANGGTGVTTLSSGQYLKGNGTGAITSTATIPATDLAAGTASGLNITGNATSATFASSFDTTFGSAPCYAARGFIVGRVSLLTTGVASGGDYAGNMQIIKLSTGVFQCVFATGLPQDYYCKVINVYKTAAATARPYVVQTDYENTTYVAPSTGGFSFTVTTSAAVTPVDPEYFSVVVFG